MAEERPTGLSDDEIRRAAVGEPPVLDGQVTLAEYDPRWPELYAREESRIRRVLGDRVVGLEHIGSTSVPGLVAKPIIDIVLIVPDSADEGAYVSDLEAAGYVLHIREPEWFEHRLLKGPDTDVNLHVVSAECTELERWLLMRDWLRINDADRDLYARTKRELATRSWKYVQNYADAKTQVVEEILERARHNLPPIR